MVSAMDYSTLCSFALAAVLLVTIAVMGGWFGEP
jgi:hypothetical protein